jgi:PAS domain-containing protein
MGMSGFELAASLVLSLLSGGLLGVWLKFRIEDRKLSAEEREGIAVRKQDAMDRALEVVTDQRDDALKLVQTITERLDKMELEVQGLRLARDLDPFPHWIIGLDGKYLYANREFEKLFLEPNGRSYRDIVGETHEEIWPDQFSRILRNLDALARRVPDGRARATTGLIIGENEMQVTVHKFPVRVRETVVAFAGYITDIQVPGEMTLGG